MSWLQKKESLDAKRTAYTKIEQGDNVFRFFEFTHRVAEVDFELERYEKGSVAVGTPQIEGFAVTRKHFKPQFAMCGKTRSMVSGSLIGDCEHCEAANEVLDGVNSSEQDKIAAKRWLGNDQYVFVVVNVNEVPYTYKTLELSRAQGMAILELQQFAEKKGRTVFGVMGKDICIRYDKNQKDPKAKYKVIEVDSSECTDFKSTPITGDVPDLLGEASMVAPEMQAKVREQNPREPKAQAAQAPAKVEAKAAPAPKAAPKAAKAKAKAQEVAWPPVVGQKVRVVFADDDKQEGVVTADEGTAGAGIWEVTVGDDLFQATLEEMEKIG